MAFARYLIPVALAVLLAHWMVLGWLRWVWPEAQVLRPMAAPMLTRMIVPQAPAPLPVPPKPVSVAPRTVVAVRPVPAPVAKPSLPAQATPTLAPVIVAQGVTPQAAFPAPAASIAATVAAPTASAPASPTPALDTWPADTRLSYRLGGYFRGELHGSARVQWQRRGDRYEVRIEIDVGPFASLAMTSQGLVSQAGLLPRAYQEDRNGKPRGAVLGENQIVFADGRTAPRPDGVQDTASQFVDLSQRFATGRSALEVGGTVSFWMSRPGAVDLWTYDVVEKETLATPKLGAVEAFHLKPRPIANPRGNITAEMWFAPSLQYLPVRIRVNMGSDVFVDLMVEKIEQR